MAPVGVFYVFLTAFMLLNAQQANGAFPARTLNTIFEDNSNGPYLGLVIPNLYEMDPLLESSSFISSNLTIDVAVQRKKISVRNHRRKASHIGHDRTGHVFFIQINAAVTTQLLLSLFHLEGVVHYGIAGNMNPSLNIGDVTIAANWSHSALWSWQRYGQGPEDALPLESAGDYTREIGCLKFANYTVNVSDSSSYDNILNNIWYQPEEVFPIDGTPEERQHAFWVSVDPVYYEISKNLGALKLEGCINSTTCLSTTPKVTRVQRGTSASTYLDNAAYRSFIYQKFNVSPVDMESASVALICLQQRVPFIAFRALSDLAGGGSADSNEADTFASLAATNSVTVFVEFIKLLSASSAASANRNLAHDCMLFGAPTSLNECPS